jgi:hypothetical protein
VKRLGIAVALGGLALATALAGPAGNPLGVASAAPTLNLGGLKLPALLPSTPTHLDYEIEGIDSYVMPGTPTDLHLALMEVHGPGMLGGSPDTVTLACLVFHNFSMNSTAPLGIAFTSADEMFVDTDTFTPPPSYLSGYAHVSGPDLSETTTNNAYSAAFIGAQAPFTTVPPTYPGYTQGSVSTYGWMHSSVTNLGSIGPPPTPAVAQLLPDSGKMVISLRGVVEHLPANPPGTGLDTFSPGAMQCQIGGHTSYPFVLDGTIQLPLYVAVGDL